jgi:hypothetical protein
MVANGPFFLRTDPKPRPLEEKQEGKEGKEQTYSLQPRPRRNPNPPQPLVLLTQLLNLPPRLPLRMKQRNGLHHALIQPIARILGRQNPLHPNLRRSLYHLTLNAHGHEMESADSGICSLESGGEERRVGVGTLFDGDC